MIPLLAEQTMADWKAIGFAVLLTLVAGGFLLFMSIMTSKLAVPDRVRRFSTGMNRLLLFIPVLAAVVFAVLFAFVLKGRFYERLSHAVLVLALWLYAARYWWFLVSYFKHRAILILSVAGMAVSAAAAIVLTPLDRYVSLIHSVTGAASIAAGIVLLALFYVLSASVKFKSGGSSQQ